MDLLIFLVLITGISIGVNRGQEKTSIVSRIGTEHVDILGAIIPRILH
jgi:hypothetical protein